MDRKQLQLVERTDTFAEATHLPSSRRHLKGLVLDDPTNDWVWVLWDNGDIKLAKMSNLRLVDVTVPAANA